MNSDKSSTTRNVSFFEFWPAWVMYFPVVIQWIFLSIRYRSLTLPFLANPSLRLSGMVGVGKSELMTQATGKAKAAILPWITHTVSDEDIDAQVKFSLSSAAEKDIHFPFACKPDIGCRGVGVKLIETPQQLIEALSHYPKGAVLVYQKLASYEPEAGIFFVKDPYTGQVEIPSMTIKILPRITGDGVHTLGQLIEQDTRAGQLIPLYYERHKDCWDNVPADGEIIRLVFSASHSKGAVFYDARKHVTPALIGAIEDIMSDIPDFYYGRLDVKYADLDALKTGKNLEIVEINGASAEFIHIWDKDAKFTEALRALMWQYRTLFRIGAYHRTHGKKPPSLRAFLKGWHLERTLTKHYPLTD